MRLTEGCRIKAACFTHVYRTPQFRFCVCSTRYDRQGCHALHTRGVQDCYQRLSSAFDLLVIFLCSLTPPLTPPPNPTPYNGMWTCVLLCTWIKKYQLSALLPEGKRTIKGQLYSGPFTLREAASFIFQH